MNKMEAPVLEVVRFASEDVIAASSGLLSGLFKTQQSYLPGNNVSALEQALRRATGSESNFWSFMATFSLRPDNNYDLLSIDESSIQSYTQREYQGMLLRDVHRIHYYQDAGAGYYKLENYNQ